MDLTKLSRDQKEELLKALQLKKLKTQEGVLDTFKPHPAQSRFLSATHTIRAFFGGNASGKTTALTIDLIWAHTGKHPYRDTALVRNSWLIVPGLDKAADYWSEIRRWCPPSLQPAPNKMGSSNIRRFDWPNGSTTTIYSHDQESTKLEGTNIDALLCDEPPPRALWVSAFRGLRNNPNYYVAIAGTPLSEAWMYEEIFLPGTSGNDHGITVIQSTIFDNPHLSKKFIEDFSARLTDDEKRVRLYGEFAALQGRIFKEFSRPTHVIKEQDWPKDWPVFMAVDPHTRKQSTAMWVGVTKDDDLVVLNETSGADIPELAEKIRGVEQAYGYWVVLRRIDNSGSDRGWNSQSAIDILTEQGIRVSPMRNQEKAVADGIVRIKKLLRGSPDARGILKPSLYVLSSCRETIREFEMYGWDSASNEERFGVREKPKKTHDDYMDPLRYIVMSNPRYRVNLETTTYGKPYAQAKPAKKEDTFEIDAEGRKWR